MLSAVVIGAGHIGQRHIDTIQKSEGWLLSAIIDPLYASTDVPVYKSLDAYLANIPAVERADVAVIASPNVLHPAQAARCLEAGMRVLIEKPIAIDRSGYSLYRSLLPRYEDDICCVMQLRYSPLVERLRHLLSTGVLGTVHQIDIHMYWNRDERYYGTEEEPHPWRGQVKQDGGALYTQFAHFIDLIYHLFGPWEVRHARVANLIHPQINIEDTGLIDFSIGAVMGSMKYTTACYKTNYGSTITILGERGTLVVGGQYFDQLVYAHPEVVRTAYDRLAEEQPPALRGHERLYAELQPLWHTGLGKVPHGLKEGLDVIDMIQQVYEASDR